MDRGVVNSCQISNPDNMQHGQLINGSITGWAQDIPVIGQWSAGLLLGALLAVGAPASEMVIVNVLGWWHYDRPDLLGVPHWAGWCYAAYAWGVGNVGRYLVQKQKIENAGAEIKGLSTRR